MYCAKNFTPKLFSLRLPAAGEPVAELAAVSYTRQRGAIVAGNRHNLHRIGIGYGHQIKRLRTGSFVLSMNKKLLIHDVLRKKLHP